VTTAPEAQRATRVRGLSLGALFFVSGALGLVYEIVWFRRLHLTLGVSLFAVGAVVSAFMLGLAVGSRWAAGSPWLRRSPLMAFAGLELGIGAYALAFPVVVGGLEALYPTLYRLMEGQPLALTFTRFVLAFGLLLPPTFLMGASLPTIAEAAGAPLAVRARKVAVLYAVNTAGAVVGTLLAGFVLIEHLGIRGSLILGAVGSALVAGGASVLARLTSPGEAGAGARDLSGPPAGPAPPSGLASLAVTAAFVAGAASLAAELVWTRALVFFVHNSTYAFSAILAVYLVGIALGALLASRFVRGSGEAVRALAATLALGSLSLLVAIGVYRHLPEMAGLLVGGRLLPPGVSGVPDTSLVLWSWGSALILIFGQVAAILLLPALFLGAVFPLTLKIAGGDEGSAAALVGRLYAFNTLGCVGGALAGTFVLVALLGTRGALLFVAWLPVPVAVWALGKATASPRARGALAALLLAAMAGGSLVAAPAGFYRDLFAQRFGPVVWFSEGMAETVAVCDHEDGSRWIQFSDGRGASGTWSHAGGWLYAHVPLLLHPAPESAAVVCFGTGNTLGAASRHPLDVIDGIELSPEVVKAAPLFADTNHDVLRDERVRIVIEDGRSYFLSTDRRYDVISEEPPLVHTAGVVNLYSRDFYELCARSLGDDGLMAVWLATWELETQEMRMLVRAFVDVFPWASVWDCTHDYEWLLVGSKTAPALDLDTLAARMSAPGLARDLARIDPEMGGIRTPADLLSLYLMGREAMVAFADGADPVTDDRSVVDYTIPRRARANFGLGEWVTGGIRTFGVGRSGLTSELRLRGFDRIYARRESPEALVADFGGRGREAFLTEVRGQAWARELRATRRTLEALRQVALDHLAMGRPEAALEGLVAGLALVPAEATGPIHRMRADVLREMGRTGEAREAAAASARADAALVARTARGGRELPGQEGASR
jgi:predicted membrane-bound spermidine synthase